MPGYRSCFSLPTQRYETKNYLNKACRLEAPNRRFKQLAFAGKTEPTEAQTTRPRELEGRLVGLPLHPRHFGSETESIDETFLGCEVMWIQLDGLAIHVLGAQQIARLLEQLTEA